MKLIQPFYHSTLSSSEPGADAGMRSSKSTYLNDPDVRKPLVISILRRNEELRLQNRVLNLTISNSGLKAVFSNASHG